MSTANALLDSSTWIDIESLRNFATRPHTSTGFYRSEHTSTDNPIIYTTYKLENARWYKQLERDKVHPSLPEVGPLRKAVPLPAPSLPPKKPSVPRFPRKKTPKLLPPIQDSNASPTEKRGDGKYYLRAKKKKQKIKKQKKSSSEEASSESDEAEEKPGKWQYGVFLPDEDEERFKNMMVDAKARKNRMSKKRIFLENQETMNLETILNNLATMDEEKLKEFEEKIGPEAPTVAAPEAPPVTTNNVLPPPMPKGIFVKQKSRIDLKEAPLPTVTPITTQELLEDSDEEIQTKSEEMLDELDTRSQFERIAGNYIGRKSMTEDEIRAQIEVNITDPLERSRALLQLLNKATDSFKGDVQSYEEQVKLREAMDTINDQMKKLDKFKKRL
jgi:hypothetical protein